MAEKRVLFVSKSNICRSPIAEYTFRDLLAAASLTGIVECDSCAWSPEHVGEKVHPEAEKNIRIQKMDCSSKRARLLADSDFRDYDYILGMDSDDVRAIKAKGISGPVIGLLGDYAGGDEIPVIRNNRDLDEAYKRIVEGCMGLGTYLIISMNEDS